MRVPLPRRAERKATSTIGGALSPVSARKHTPRSANEAELQKHVATPRRGTTSSMIKGECRHRPAGPIPIKVDLCAFGIAYNERRRALRLALPAWLWAPVGSRATVPATQHPGQPIHSHRRHCQMPEVVRTRHLGEGRAQVPANPWNP